jgi:hypothetical protein
MARISQPFIELNYLWQKAGNEKDLPDITRAYHRLDGKFVPIGWYLYADNGTPMLVTDAEVADVDFAEAIQY